MQANHPPKGRLGLWFEIALMIGRSLIGSLCLSGAAVEGVPPRGAQDITNLRSLGVICFAALLALSAISRFRFRWDGGAVLRIAIWSALAIHLALWIIRSATDPSANFLLQVAGLLMFCFVLGGLASAIARPAVQSRA